MIVEWLMNNDIYFTLCGIMLLLFKYKTVVLGNTKTLGGWLYDHKISFTAHATFIILNNQMMVRNIKKSHI